MPTTIGVQVTLFAGATDLTLELLVGGTLLNTGGDALTHVARGYFTASVGESIDSNTDYIAVVKKNGTAVFESVLYAGQTVVGKQVQLDASDFVVSNLVVAVPRLVAQSTLGGIPQLRRVDADEPGQFIFYRGTQWAMVLENVGSLPEGNEIYMTMKSGDLITVLDTAAVLQIKVNLTTDAVTLIRLNQSAPDSGLLDKLDMVYESYVESSVTKHKVTITLGDDITALIAPATYSYDLKSVGAASKLLDIGLIDVAASVTRAH